MTVTNSTKRKPGKPYPEFPLFAHNNGQWCRKIRGKLYSFGLWGNPTEALAKHNAEYSFLKEGISPPQSFDGWRVGELVKEYLAVLNDRLAVGEIGQRHYEGMDYCGRLLLEYIDENKAVEALTPDDFRELRTGMMKRFAPVNTRANMVRIRSFFKFAYDEQLIGKPVFYGRGFGAPTKAMIRKARNAKPKKLFSPEQVHLLQANASPCLRAMILLSINTGMNNADLGNIQFRHVNLKTGWMDYPRHKTGIQRRAKLWPETVKAVQDYVKVRQTPHVQFESQIFITKARQQWGHTSLPSEFRKLLDATNEAHRQAIIDECKKKRRKPPEDIADIIPHGSFGYFRHTFETIGGGCRDQVAVNAIMGHVDDSMAAEYRESIEDERLEAVATHVRQWLFGKRGAK
jgi:integrase